MGFLFKTFVVLAILAASNSAFELDDGFADAISDLDLVEDVDDDDSMDEHVAGADELHEEKNDERSDLVVNTIIGHGYPVESHTVITQDGYFLRMHRIPSSPNLAASANKTKQPVLLVHGMFDSTGTFVLMGPQIGLAYFLADAGYDVWMGNVRGNRYSRRHRTLNPDGFRPQRRQFWNFSWHEMGLVDLPAMIDYILANNTDFQKIHYIGHSQGTTAFFVMASRRPEYNAKILLMNALAPVVFMENLRSPTSRVLSRFQPLLQAALATLGVYEFHPDNTVTSQINQALCREGTISAELCQNIMIAFYGFNPELTNKSMASVFRQHTPAGLSTRQLVHYGQLLRRNTGFRAYDYGRIGNIQHHGSPVPPQYPLNQITAPIALHYGLNDVYTAVVDVRRLAAVLPNLVELREVPHPRFGHLEFVWATEVRTLVYDHMLTLMQTADENENLEDDPKVNN